MLGCFHWPGGKECHKLNQLFHGLPFLQWVSSVMDGLVCHWTLVWHRIHLTVCIQKQKYMFEIYGRFLSCYLSHHLKIWQFDCREKCENSSKNHNVLSMIYCAIRICDTVLHGFIHWSHLEIPVKASTSESIIEEQKPTRWLWGRCSILTQIFSFTLKRDLFWLSL